MTTDDPTKSAPWLPARARPAVAAALAVVWGLAARGPVPPHDYYWHIAYGRMIVNGREIPRVDALSLAHRGEPFVDQPWLAQVLLYAWHRAGGLALSLSCTALCVCGAYSVLLAGVARRTGRPVLASALLLAAVVPASGDNWAPRPQTLALPLFALTLALAQRARTSPRSAWWLMPVFALWSNLHGSFVLGPALVALVLFGALLDARRGDPSFAPGAAKALALAALGAALATFCNPHGPRAWVYALALARTPALRAFVSEWQPPSPFALPDAYAHALLGATVLAALYGPARARRVALADMLPLLFTAALALAAVRNAVWLGFAALPVLATSLEGRLRAHLDAPTPPRPALDGLVLALAFAAAALAAPFARRASLEDPVTPARSVPALRALAPVRLYHSESAGSYLAWALPAQPVWLDPRFEFYPFATWRDDLALRSGRDALATVDSQRFDALLLDDEEHRGLLRALARTPGPWLMRDRAGRHSLWVRGPVR